MKDFLEKLIADKKAEFKKLQERSDASNDLAEVRALGETLTRIRDEINAAEEQLAKLDEPADDMTDDARGLNVVATMQTRKAEDNGEERANALYKSGRMTMDNSEARAVLVSSGKIATPTEVGGINDPVGARVSSIVDMVKITDASGMGAYKVAYLDTDATAAAQTEGGAYNASDPTFGFVEITPATEAVLSYISKQARKQTPLNYTQKVEESARVALRKRAAAIITTAITGSDLVTKQTGVTLNETALRKIALKYGGDESVVGAATLFINKADLVTLGDVRGSDKKPVYEITPDAQNPNTGIIRDGGLAVPYCINSNLASGTMIYGQPQNFELALFSNYEIMVSEDFAFDKGLLAVRGDVELGGAVTVKGGFIVATVAAG